MDVHGRLSIDERREHFLGAGGNGGIAADQAAHDAAHRLDAERKGSDIQEKHVLDTASQDARLDGCAEGDDLIRIELAMRRLAEEGLDLLANERHSRGTTDQYHFVDVGR